LSLSPSLCQRRYSSPLGRARHTPNTWTMWTYIALRRFIHCYVNATPLMVSYTFAFLGYIHVTMTYYSTKSIITSAPLSTVGNLLSTARLELALPVPRLPFRKVLLSQQRLNIFNAELPSSTKLYALPSSTSKTHFANHLGGTLRCGSIECRAHSVY
jgi:hypothetical protein